VSRLDQLVSFLLVNQTGCTCPPPPPSIPKRVSDKRGDCSGGGIGGLAGVLLERKSLDMSGPILPHCSRSLVAGDNEVSSAEGKIKISDVTQDDSVSDYGVRNFRSPHIFFRDCY